MNRTRLIKIVVGAILLVILFTIVAVFKFYFLDPFLTSGPQRLHESSDWSRWVERLPPGEDEQHLRSNDPSIPVEMRPAIMIRTARDGSELLLKHNFGTVVYRYLRADESIGNASESDWLAADGAISRCGWVPDGFPSPSVTFEAYPDYETRVNGQTLATHGRYSLFALGAPSNDRVAVTTASGWRSGPGLGYIGLGGSNARIVGRLYLEVMDTKTQQPLMRPIRISTTADLEEYRPCWERSERYIVVYDPFITFSVIPLD